MKNILTKNFNEKGYILDLGCGPGSQLKELTSSNRIIGLDSSLILLREAVKQNKNLLPERLFICGDTFNLPLKNNSINGAYSRMFIYHFQKWESILKELARICRKGSTLNIHFVNYEYYESQSSILFDFMNPKDNSLYYSAPSISEISQVATNLGLMITSRYPVQFFNNPLILVDSNFKNFDQKLKNSSYLNLIIWFELNITKLLPINSSPWQVIEFEKISDS
jgi:SAM-dependent methyltransferase